MKGHQANAIAVLFLFVFFLEGIFLLDKSDIFQKIMWYSYVNDPGNLMAIPVDKVMLILEENIKGILPDKLEDFTKVIEKKSEFESGAGQDDLTRFDHL